MVNNKEDVNEGFDYRRADYGKFSADLLNVEWNEKFKDKTVDGIWTEFVSVVNGMKEKHAPRFAGKKKRKPKWMDYKACKALKKKYQAWKRYTNSPSYQGYVQFKRDRNVAISELRRSKRKFEEKLPADIRKDSKTFFGYVRSNIGVRDRMGPLKDEQGKSIDDDRTMGEMLNKFFSSVFTRSDNSDRVDTNPGVSDDHVNTGENELWISEELILEHIGKIKENKFKTLLLFFSKSLS